MEAGHELIAAERKRQISEEGWIAQHDDCHDEGQLWKAALCYATPIEMHSLPNYRGYVPMPWPWHPMWWKPKDRISDLVRAGALIAAEIDRLQRKASLAAQRPDGE